MNIIEIKTRIIAVFCLDEVSRQGWDIKSASGLKRAGWMIDAWAYALFHQNHLPTDIDILALGHRIEPEVNRLDRFRSIGVMVGGRICPNGIEVPGLIDKWLQNLPSMTPDEAYLEFEMIHPFVDGNGRVGKILHNWLNDTLHDPVLVPNFFGGSNP